MLIKRLFSLTVLACCLFGHQGIFCGETIVIENTPLKQIRYPDADVKNITLQNISYPAGKLIDLLKFCPSLTTLTLATGTKITNLNKQSGIQPTYFESVTELIISSQEISTDTLLRLLPRLTKLKRLDLTGSNISPDDRLNIIDACPQGIVFTDKDRKMWVVSQTQRPELKNKNSININYSSWKKKTPKTPENKQAPQAEEIKKQNPLNWNVPVQPQCYKNPESKEPANREIEEKIELLIPEPKSETAAQECLYALIWLLCTENKDLKPINAAQERYKNLTNKKLKEQLKIVVQKFPNNAVELLNKYLGSSFFIRLSEDSEDYKVTTSSVIRELLEAGCDPMILLLNSNLFTNAFPSEDIIKNKLSMYWIGCSPTDDEIKRELESFAKHRPIVIKALHDALKKPISDIIAQNNITSLKEEALLCNLHRLDFSDEECNEFLKIPTQNQNEMKNFLSIALPTKENLKQFALRKEWFNRLTRLKAQESKPDIIALKQCITDGLNLNEPLFFDGKQYTDTPFILFLDNMYLSFKEKEDFVHYMIDNKANVNACDYCGNSPLYLMATSRQKELFELLLKKGATLDEKTQLKAEAKWGKGCCDLMLKEIQESKPLPKATDLLSSMTNQMDPKDVKQNTANDINGVMNKYTNSSNSQPTNNQQNIPTTTTFKKTKNQPGHWYKNPWIWTGIACGAGLAVWGAYAYLHKKPFVPALLTRTILQLKQRVMSRFSTARTHSLRYNPAGHSG